MGDRGDQEENSGSQRGEASLASNQFPKCSPHTEHPERLTELGRKVRREEGYRDDLGE